MCPCSPIFWSSFFHFWLQWRILVKPTQMSLTRSFPGHNSHLFLYIIILNGTKGSFFFFSSPHIIWRWSRTGKCRPCQCISSKDRLRICLHTAWISSQEKKKNPPLLIYPLHITRKTLGGNCKSSRMLHRGDRGRHFAKLPSQFCRVVVLKCKRPLERLSSLPHWRL